MTSQDGSASPPADKDARAVKAWGRLGFGFAELGTITARPQPGNNKPRLFRLVSSEGIINRMGFNNQGAEALARRLSGAGIRRGNNKMGLPLGISIGKNKVTPLDSATDDYLFALSTLADYADYVAINISSPNTPGLRNLQDEKALGALIEALVDRAKDLAPADPLPLFVKLAPDLSENQLAAIVDICEEAGASGIIAANTTVGRGEPGAQRCLVGEPSGWSFRQAADQDLHRDGRENHFAHAAARHGCWRHYDAR